jgi:hypothetical protein
MVLRSSVYDSVDIQMVQRPSNAIAKNHDAKVFETNCMVYVYKGFLQLNRVQKTVLITCLLLFARLRLRCY